MTAHCWVPYRGSAFVLLLLSSYLVLRTRVMLFVLFYENTAAVKRDLENAPSHSPHCKL